MQSFSYTASIKLLSNDGKVAALAETYPGVTDLSLASRQFVDYNECVTSCKQLMTDLKDKINLAASDKVVFKINSEINPVYSGTATLSKDWDVHEVARLWIFDEKMEGTGRIQAVGQARIFQTERTTSFTLSS
jgi:uncharacterized secreted protein with C-terminal beta-propeller domain